MYKAIAHTVLFLCFVSWNIAGFSQNDTIRLKSVEVAGEASSDNNLFADTLLHTQNIPLATYEKINFLPAVSVKPYGITGFAPVYINSLPSRFAKITYQGLELNSVMSGDADLNSLPEFLIDFPIILSGTSNFPYQVDFSQDKNSSVKTTWESSSNLSVSANYNSNNKNPITIAAGLSNKKNNFTVFNPYTDSLQTLKGYEAINYGLFVSKNSTLTKSISAKLSALYYNDAKNVIQNLSYSGTLPFMLNEHFSALSEIKIKLSVWTTTNKIQFSKHFLLYNDTVKSIFSHNNSYKTFASQTFSRKIGRNFSLKIKANYTNEKAVTNNYETDKVRNILSATTSILTTYQKLTAKISPTIKYNSRTKSINAEIGGSAKIKLPHKVQTSVYAGSLYHYPTFNDLFWSPGGNEDLKPEHLNIIMAKVSAGKQNKITLSSSYTVTTNEIIWQPQQGSVFWTPINLDKTKRFSISVILNLFKQYGKLKIYGMNSFTRFFTETQEGKFIIFQPLIKNNAYLTINYNSFVSFSLQAIYTGLRYTNTTNTSYLPAFLVINNSLEIRALKNLTIGLGVKNLTNEQYEYIPQMPMPLRYFFVNAKLLFNHKNQ